MKPYAITWWRAVDDAKSPGLRFEWTGAELAEQLASPLPFAGPKKALPCIVPAAFGEGGRNEANVEAVHLLGLDFDTPTADPSGVVARIHDALGVEVFAYSTFSSEPAGYRLRALVPYDAPITGLEHRRSWAVAVRILARHGLEADRSCSDPCRALFVWAVPPSGAYFHAHVPGDPWPAVRAARIEADRLDRERERREREAAERAARRRDLGDVMERARRYLAKCEPAIQGANGSRATFLAAAKLLHGFDLEPDVVLDLMAAEYNPRCRPPWSEKELARKVTQAAERGRDFVRGSLLNAERKAS